MLGLYIVYQARYRMAGSYIQAVVVAKDTEQAKRVMPEGGFCEPPFKEYECGWAEPCFVDADFIGIAADGLKAGDVLLAIKPDYD